MAESPVEEYVIDLDHPEETLKSLKVRRVIVMTTNGERVFSYPNDEASNNLYRLVNAYLALFTRIEPWTMIENSGRRAYIFKDGDNIIAVETNISTDDFEALSKILAFLVKELREKQGES